VLPRRVPMAPTPSTPLVSMISLTVEEVGVAPVLRVALAMGRRRTVTPRVHPQAPAGAAE
jgi:hypothetical protein